MTKTWYRDVCKCALVVILFVSVGTVSAEQVDLTGYLQVQVDIQSKAEYELLKTISTTILTDHAGRGEIDAVIAPDRIEDLQNSGLTYIIEHHNLQQVIDREQAAWKSGGRGTWDAYMNLSEINAFFTALATNRPDLCTISSIGTSLQGRDIWMLHITGTPAANKPAVLYEGLIHCREWISGALMAYIADHLVNNYDTDPDVQAMVDGLDIYLVPVVNPDGYSYTWTNYRLWRKNRRNNGDGSYGVDLNRNWGYAWGYNNSGSSPTPSHDLYRGTGPFSEPETQVMRDFMIAHPNIVAYMDYHSYSQLILWPWGYDCLGGPDDPDGAAFTAIGNSMQSLIQAVHGKYYEPGPICETIYDANGGSVDWAYGELGIFGFTIELRDTGTYGFELPPAQILPTCEENLPAILHLTEWALSQVGTRISLPNGAPTLLEPGVPQDVDVTIVPIGEDVVPGSPTLHYRYDGGAFLTSPLTFVSGNLYRATLPAPACADSPEFYFSAEGSLGATAYSPADAPASFYSASVGAYVALFDDTFDFNPGWTTQGLWGFGTPTGNGGEYGGPDPTSGYTGTHVYGYNLNGDYEDGLSERHLTSPAIDCTGMSNVHLNFWRWLGVEQPSYDHAYVRVSNNGTSWTTVWQNGGTIEDAAWTEMDLDISAVADNQATVYLRWTMGTSDSSWAYCGWNIDDVKLLTFGCEDAACPDPADGDINGDGPVNGADIQLFVSGLLGTPTTEQMCHVDFDGDKALGTGDIPGMVTALLGS